MSKPNPDLDRPRFLPSFIELVRAESEERGFWAVIPFVLLGCIAVGAVVAYLVPATFWSDDRWDVSTAVYAGLMTFSGLVLALGWNAFSRIYAVLFRGEFGAYLVEKKILHHYLVHISTMHFMQLVAVVLAGVGLTTVLLDRMPLWADRIILAAALASTVYALKQASDAVTAMNDLVWQSAIFERHQRARPAGGNVVTAFGDRNG